MDDFNNLIILMFVFVVVVISLIAASVKVSRNTRQQIEQQLRLVAAIQQQQAIARQQYLAALAQQQSQALAQQQSQVSTQGAQSTVPAQPQFNQIDLQMEQLKTQLQNMSNQRGDLFRGRLMGLGIR